MKIRTNSSGCYKLKMFCIDYQMCAKLGLLGLTITVMPVIWYGGEITPVAHYDRTVLRSGKTHSCILKTTRRYQLNMFLTYYGGINYMRLHCMIKGSMPSILDDHVQHLSGAKTKESSAPIGHVDEYPTMHYFGNPRHTQYMIAYNDLD